MTHSNTEPFIYPKHSDNANISNADYENLRQTALNNPSDFWANIARQKITWHKDFTVSQNTSFSPDAVDIKWFQDGQLNACYNAIDRHYLKSPDKTAMIYESDCGEKTVSYSYADMYHHVNRAAAVLQKMGVQKGDVVVIYMPMIAQSVFMMLACSRIGAVHCVVFGGFSAAALASRIHTVQAKWVITADEGIRGGRTIPLKHNVDMAVNDCDSVKNILVVQHTYNPDIIYDKKRDIIYNGILKSDLPDNVPCVFVDSEHPLFILYTSGSTGKPKGLVHSTGGYCVYTSYTHELVFDLKEDDVYFCTADIGWITGHSYMVYAPLINNTTIILFEGVPTYPDASRFWQICEKHHVSIFYTAPTALRTLMSFGDDFILKHDLSSLRVLGSVGEPINPEVWHWYYNVIGQKNCPIVDTWWQTETGGFIISSVANTTPMQAGYAGKPLPAIDANVTDAGEFVIKNSWPAQARTIFGDHKRFMKSYFSEIPNCYQTGDGAIINSDGYIQITGRTDDVINVSGHRMGTAEFESVLVSHDKIAEAAVVGCPHPIKGQGVYAYVTLMQGNTESDALIAELKQLVRTQIGAIAGVDIFHFTPDLPKTRSGKIMRRILRKIAMNDFEDLGDISTLANPEIVQNIIKNHINII